MLKKYINWLKENPKKPAVQMLLMIVISTFVILFLNLVERKSILSNMNFVLFAIIMYSDALFLNRYVHHNWLQWVFSVVVSFILLTLQMFSDGSYVDYTSFIVFAVVSIFLSSMLLLITKVAGTEMVQPI